MALSLSSSFSLVAADASKDSSSDSPHRLTIGCHGEAVFTRNWYSDQYQWYIDPESYKGKSHGRFDLPHVVIYLGYDFGKGWSMGSEIEFEHGSVESAVEIENEESGESTTRRWSKERSSSRRSGAPIATDPHGLQARIR